MLGRSCLIPRCGVISKVKKLMHRGAPHLSSSTTPHEMCYEQAHVRCVSGHPFLELQIARAMIRILIAAVLI